MEQLSNKVERRKKRLSHRLLTGLRQEGSWRWRFLTLTSSLLSPKNINRSWHIFRKRLKRKYGFDFEYLAVKELSEASKLIHLHIIYKSKQWVDAELLRREWLDIHKANQINIKSIASLKQIKNYLTKYMAKSVEFFKRSFWYSFNWLPSGWRYVWKELWRKVLVEMSLSVQELWQKWNMWLAIMRFDRWSFTQGLP